MEDEDTKRQEPGRPAKEEQHPDGRLMRDGVTRFKQWSDRLAQAMVDNLNRNVLKEHGAEEVARDKSKDH